MHVPTSPRSTCRCSRQQSCCNDHAFRPDSHPHTPSYFQYLTITETTTRSSAIPATNLSTILPTLSSPNTSGHGYGWKSTSRVGRAPTARPHSIRPCAPRSVLLLEMFFRRSHHIDDWCKLSQNHFAGYATFRSLLTSVPPTLPSCHSAA